MGSLSQPSAQTYEKLGAFYLGRGYDLGRGEVTEDLLLYDAKDLTTHAVCVGMTGSGKTGLCVSLLEEAAIDGVPTIAIDPKGDLGNLLLTFPSLQAGDFRPWIDPDEAARKGATPDEYATQMADLWRNGLASWGQDGERIARFRDAADVAIYTPGSNAGLPVTVLRSFAAPAPELVADVDAFRERISTSVSGLLTLLGLEADPIRSREHILLSNILDHAWREGRDLDLAGLIAEIQSPPFTRVGVMDLDSFFPSKDRFALSMTLNNLLASPGFGSWLEGEPLEIPRFLWTAQGRPRISIFSIAHLSEAQRMFFVTVLLNEIVAWMRGQSGTTTLRALLYMDEVFGYFPPTANPPSKVPMLTLLKQARAYGLGVVLATQNPVDLDYKGLSNTGTWFLGRLQTERDKMRVLEGLEGASATAGATFDRARMEQTLAGLRSRVFLMHNVHEDQPTLFHTRWALSYLRGPLTRNQIKGLMDERRAAAAPTATAAPPAASAPARLAPRESTGDRPVIPADVPQLFCPTSGAGAAGSRLLYRPALLGSADLHFANARAGIDAWRQVSYLAPLREQAGPSIWESARQLTGELQLQREPEPDGQFGTLPAPAAKASTYGTWEKSLKTHLYRDQAVTVWKCKLLKLMSKPGETEAEFRVRVREASHEKRDLEMEKLRKRFTSKITTVRGRVTRAQEKIDRESDQYRHQKTQTAISFGATLLGALFGRKMASVGTVGRASTTARSVSRAAREKGDIERARERLEEQQERLAELEHELEAELERVRERTDPDALEIGSTIIRPRKSDTAVRRVALVWTPWRISADGIAEVAYEESDEAT